MIAPKAQLIITPCPQRHSFRPSVQPTDRPCHFVTLTQMDHVVPLPGVGTIEIELGETVIPRVVAPTPPSTRFIQVRVTKKRHDRPPDVESGHPPLSHTCHPGQIPNCPKSGKNSKFRLFPIRSQMPPNAMKRRKTSPKRRFQLPFPTNSSLWHHLGTPRRSPRTSVQSNTRLRPHSRGCPGDQNSNF